MICDGCKWIGSSKFPNWPNTEILGAGPCLEPMDQLHAQILNPTDPNTMMVNLFYTQILSQKYIFILYIYMQYNYTFFKLIAMELDMGGFGAGPKRSTSIFL